MNINKDTYEPLILQNVDKTRELSKCNLLIES